MNDGGKIVSKCFFGISFGNIDDIVIGESYGLILSLNGSGSREVLGFYFVYNIVGEIGFIEVLYGMGYVFVSDGYVVFMFECFNFGGWLVGDIGVFFVEGFFEFGKGGYVLFLFLKIGVEGSYMVIIIIVIVIIIVVVVVVVIIVVVVVIVIVGVIVKILLVLW